VGCCSSLCGKGGEKAQQEEGRRAVQRICNSSAQSRIKALYVWRNAGLFVHLHDRVDPSAVGNLGEGEKRSSETQQGKINKTKKGGETVGKIFSGCVEETLQKESSYAQPLVQGGGGFRGNGAAQNQTEAPRKRKEKHSLGRTIRLFTTLARQFGKNGSEKTRGGRGGSDLNERMMEAHETSFGRTPAKFPFRYGAAGSLSSEGKKKGAQAQSFAGGESSIRYRQSLKRGVEDQPLKNSGGPFQALVARESTKRGRKQSEDSGI